MAGGSEEVAWALAHVSLSAQFSRGLKPTPREAPELQRTILYIRNLFYRPTPVLLAPLNLA
jgi:hypothetical protein